MHEHKRLPGESKWLKYSENPAESIVINVRQSYGTDYEQFSKDRVLWQCRVAVAEIPFVDWKLCWRLPS